MLGYPLIDNWNETTDSPPLFVGTLRVLALKAAVSASRATSPSPSWSSRRPWTRWFTP